MHIAILHKCPLISADSTKPNIDDGLLPLKRAHPMHIFHPTLTRKHQSYNYDVDCLTTHSVRSCCLELGMMAQNILFMLPNKIENNHIPYIVTNGRRITI